MTFGQAADSVYLHPFDFFTDFTDNPSVQDQSTLTDQFENALPYFGGRLTNDQVQLIGSEDDAYIFADTKQTQLNAGASEAQANAAAQAAVDAQHAAVSNFVTTHEGGTVEQAVSSAVSSLSWWAGGVGLLLLLGVVLLILHEVKEI